MPCEPQDSIVTSSQDGAEPAPTTKGGMKQQRNKMVAKVLPTVRREEGTGEGEGERAKPARPRGFPWMTKFSGRCREVLGSHSYDRLDQLMDFYYRQVSRDVRCCYRGPNRAYKLKCQMKEHMYLFYLLYADVSRPIDNDQFLERMTRLLSFYLDMELKASRRGKENLKAVSERLTSVLFILLDNKMEHIIEAIVESKFFGKKYHEICILIIEKLYGKLLEARPVKMETHTDYVNYILMFRKWKKMLAKSEWPVVSGKAAKCVLPPPGFMDVYYNGKAKWTRRLPALSRYLPRPTPERFTYALVQGGVKNVIVDSDKDEEDVEGEGEGSVAESEPKSADDDVVSLLPEDCPQSEQRCSVHMRAIWSELAQMSLAAVDCPLDELLYDNEFLARLRKELEREEKRTAAAGRRLTGPRRTSKDADQSQAEDCYDEAVAAKSEDDVPDVVEADSQSCDEIKQEPEEGSAVPVGRVVPTGSPDRITTTEKISSPPVVFPDRILAVGSPERILPVEKIPPVNFADKTVLDGTESDVECEEISPAGGVDRISPEKIPLADSAQKAPCEYKLLSVDSPEKIPCEYKILSVDSPEKIPCEDFLDKIPAVDSSDYVPIDDTETKIPLVGSLAGRVLPLVLPDNIVLSEESLELIQALVMQDNAGRTLKADPAFELLSVKKSDEDKADRVLRSDKDTEQPNRVQETETLAVKSLVEPLAEVSTAEPAPEIDPLLTNAPCADPPPINPQLLQLWTTSEANEGGNEEEFYPDAGDITAMYGEEAPWVTYEDLYNQYHSGNFNAFPDLDTPDMSWTQGDPFWSASPLDEMLDDPAYMQQTTHFDGFGMDQQHFGGFSTTVAATDHNPDPPPPTPPTSPPPSPSPAVVYANDRRKGKRGPRKRYDQKTNKVEEYILCKMAKEKGTTVEEVGKKGKPGRKRGCVAVQQADDEESEPASPPRKRPAPAGRNRKQERPPTPPAPPAPPPAQARRGRGRGRGGGRKARRR